MSKTRALHELTRICAHLSSAGGSIAPSTSWRVSCLNQCFPSRRKESVWSPLPIWDWGAPSLPGSDSSTVSLAIGAHKAQGIWGQKKQKRHPPLTQMQVSLLWHDTLAGSCLLLAVLFPSTAPVRTGIPVLLPSSSGASVISRFLVTIGEAERGNLFYIFSAWVGIEKVCSLCSVRWDNLGSSNPVSWSLPSFALPKICAWFQHTSMGNSFLNVWSYLNGEEKLSEEMLRTFSLTFTA